MPVDKFGHTDVGYSQRVIAGGVTLSQVNATFLRLNGTNATTGDLILIIINWYCGITHNISSHICWRRAGHLVPSCGTNKGRNHK